MAYLIGEWEFYGLPLDISERVLIPRPDTEVLAAAAIAKSWVVLVYLPYLVLAGLITGTLTGLCAQLVVGRLSRN